jgi:hypothetical protein
MKLIKYAFAVALFIPNLAFSFDFKGIEVGAKSDIDSISKNIGINCHDSKPEPGGFCMGETTITQTKAEISIIYDAENVVDRISLKFSPDSFNTVKAALIEKFGKPNSDITEKVQTGMGAVFEQNTVTWLKNGTIGDDMMYLNKYAKTISESQLVIISKAGIVKTKKSTQKRKSDI